MIDREVKVYVEHGGGDHFNVTPWEESTDNVKLTYHVEVEDPPPPLDIPAMSEEEFTALVESVRFVMGWSV